MLVDGMAHFLSAAAAALVGELAAGYELVWCSGWEDRADAHLPFELGLPGGLHHLSFGDAGSSLGSLPSDLVRHWKLDAIDAFAGPERALAWIDDDHDDTCAAWASERYGPTLLVATDPAEGITDAHVRTLRSWARSL